MPEVVIQLNVENSLLDLLHSRNEAQAKLLFDSLCTIVTKYNRSAGYLDSTRLRTDLPENLNLKDQPQYGSDLKQLRSHAQKTLESINDEIGLRLQLPRTEIIDRLEETVRKQDVLVISGEPMVGKSGLLKLLAARLQLEGEVLAFFVEDFATSTTLVSFLHSINIISDIDDLLAAAGNATNRCIFIDGLERATDHKKRCVINDILFAVREFNKALVARGGHPDYRRRVVFTCRLAETKDVLFHLDTCYNLQANSLMIEEVRALTDEELEEVVEQVPKLKELAPTSFSRCAICGQ